MKIKVSLYVDGTQFDEIVESRDYESAKRTALSRNPTARVVRIQVLFLNMQDFLRYYLSSSIE
tara:strand:- start:552 stop:740 length:189 start_codon:yes stop_codon:yes gene_type:complete